VSADLYLQDLAGTPHEVYREWLDNDSWAAQLAVLDAHGYGEDTDPPAGGWPEHICREMRAAAEEAQRRHDTADRVLDIRHAQRVWIGQVSWAKAAFGLQGGTWDDYVPTTVERVQNLYIDAPVLTRALLAETMVALNVPDGSIYSRRTQHVTRRDVADLWSLPGARRTRRGPYRMVSVRSRGIGRPRPVRQWLEERLGHRIYPLSA
jgi:hypothetical protein